MEELKITRTNFLLIVCIWGFVFLTLALAHYTRFELLNLVGFSFLVIVPGLLTVFSLDMKKLDVWGYVTFSIGFSIFELICITLLGNTLLPFFGIFHPLDSTILLWEIYSLVVFLIGIFLLRVKKIDIPLKRYVVFEHGRDVTYACVPAAFVIAAIFGAIQLNNGVHDIFTCAMLICMALYSFFIVNYSEQIDEHVFPIIFFFSSLALLFMTSLRGTIISGHDIQREYYVFQLAKDNGIWSVASFRDAYNACLSITLLPTIFSKLLNVFDPYVYKILFQIIFATVPGMLYVQARRFVSPAIAFLSTFYFIAFPTFFADMAYLNRQEIAFLFLALMIYVIVDEQNSIAVRRYLFLLFGIGMVVSHYSTTYTVVAILVFFIVAEPILRLIGKYVRKKKFFYHSALVQFDAKVIKRKPFITVWMVIIIAGASFLWSSVLTNTASDSLYRVVSETFSVIQKNTKEDAQAGEVSYSLLSWHTPSPDVLLQEYVEKNTALRSQAPLDTYYDSSAYSNYPITVLAGDSVPLTRAGKILSTIGVNVFSFNNAVRQAAAKLLQILVCIGFISLLYTKRSFKKPLSDEYVLLAIGSMIFMAAIVVLPVLSVEYGVLRAFQQGLMFLGLLIVIGSLTFFTKYSEKTRIYAVSVIAIIFFLATTGVFVQLFGGYDPQLYLNNSGLYYNVYYTHPTEIAGLSWLLQHNDSEMQMDGYSVNKLDSISDIADMTQISDIYPSLIKKDSYVFLNFTNVMKRQSTFSYNGTLITYAYPVQFLAANKNLVYTNGEVQVYR